MATRLELLEGLRIASQNLHAEAVTSRLERLEGQLGANADLARTQLEWVENQLGQMGRVPGKF